MDAITGLTTKLHEAVSADAAGIFSYITLFIRFLLPLCAGLVAYRAIRSLLRGHDDPEEWGYLSLPNGARVGLYHWENIIGRSQTADVRLNYPTLSRSHAALIRDDKGAWRLYDLQSKGGVFLNKKKIDKQAEIDNGDIIKLGGVELVFVTMGPVHQAVQAMERERPGRVIKPSLTLTFLTLFQLLLGFALCIAPGEALSPAVPIAFLALTALTWLTYIATRLLRRVAFEAETLAFLLCTIGMAVTASAAPGDLYRQTAILTVGVGLYFLIGWFLRDLANAVRLRWPIGIAGLVLLALNLLLSPTVFGARNWLSIGGMSFQPSEFVKLAFVFVGAATLDRLFAKRNLFLFVAYAGVCVIALALIGDFGTALIFFVAYLVVAFIRSGDLGTVSLSVAGAGLAGFLAVTYKSHVAARFATWGHAWEAASTGGYQQTRTMAAAASGGLFGVGPGNGWLKNIFAADTDLVFGMVSEELGLILAVIAVAAVLALVLYAVRASRTARSSYYVIAACAAAAILVFQMLLNVLGSVDILPLTGVTFPFVSKGGSSLVACWGLLAFIKAADTRQNASLALKMPKRLKKRQIDLDEEY
ncbi:FtsW/RodA/SpoVE family cell cycle protein [Oscillospiraceae bacterium WX1]